VFNRRSLGWTSGDYATSNFPPLQPIQSGAVHARRVGLRHPATRRSIEHPFRNFKAAGRYLRRLSAPKYPHASPGHHLMHEHPEAEHEMPRIKTSLSSVRWALCCRIVQRGRDSPVAEQRRPNPSTDPAVRADHFSARPRWPAPSLLSDVVSGRDTALSAPSSD
jgi:hypothetical protein